MAQTFRSSRFLCGAAIAVVLASVAPAGAQAQTLTTQDAMARQRGAIALVESNIVEYEQARVRGACGELSEISSRISSSMDQLGAMTQVPAETLADLRGRRDEVERRPCPPQDSSTSERATSAYTGRFNDFRISVTYDSFNDARTGIGFQRDGELGEAPETFAGLTPSRIPVTGVELGGDFGRLGFSLGYGWGDGNNDFRISDHLDSGIVYGALSPNGDSGIAAPFGLSGHTELAIRMYSLEAQYSLVGPTRDEIKAKMLGFDAGPYGFVRRFRREYNSFAEGGLMFEGFDFHFEQRREQRLTDDQFGGGIFIESGVNVSRALSAHLSARAGAYHYSTRLRSFERNMNNFTGPPDDDFTLEFDEEENGIGYEFETGFRLDRAIGRSASIYVGTRLGYRSSIGQIRNLFSGDQSFVDGMTTGIGRDDLWIYGGEVGLRVTY